MNPHIIIDAWDFTGFSSTCNGIAKHGMVGNHLRVKENGWLKVETSWGIEEFFPGDRIIILDVAASISEGGDPIDELNLKFLHELCHWAEDIHRPDREHGPIWSAFLKSLFSCLFRIEGVDILDKKVNGVSLYRDKPKERVDD